MNVTRTDPPHNNATEKLANVNVIWVSAATNATNAIEDLLAVHRTVIPVASVSTIGI